jgi:predicted XRE-type DNA-binding protein
LWAFFREKFKSNYSVFQDLNFSMADYKDHLGNAEFVKYGIVISSLIWEKTHSQIAETFRVSKPYVSQVLKRWNTDDQFKDLRINNGGSNKKLSKSKQEFDSRA